MNNNKISFVQTCMIIENFTISNWTRIANEWFFNTKAESKIDTSFGNNDNDNVSGFIFLFYLLVLTCEYIFNLAQLEFKNLDNVINRTSKCIQQCKYLIKSFDLTNYSLTPTICLATIEFKKKRRKIRNGNSHSIGSNSLFLNLDEPNQIKCPLLPLSLYKKYNNDNKLFKNIDV
ncbi:hypothetical protein BpHYR1_008233 [Brachionus plicatilis]|uniref:Uncharacterized protein n=1 Tax=Brachionus plicatilis TaxID=10195 RepID=A0A3M7SPU8_BRAPC|nr:hypothetical protein BpHYR1_008233 [Brachionus plicatilis]